MDKVTAAVELQAALAELARNQSNEVAERVARAVEVLAAPAPAPMPVQG